MNILDAVIGNVLAKMNIKTFGGLFFGILFIIICAELYTQHFYLKNLNDKLLILEKIHEIDKSVEIREDLENIIKKLNIKSNTIVDDSKNLGGNVDVKSSFIIGNFKYLRNNFSNILINTLYFLIPWIILFLLAIVNTIIEKKDNIKETLIGFLLLSIFIFIIYFVIIFYVNPDTTWFNILFPFAIMLLIIVATTKKK